MKYSIASLGVIDRSIARKHSIGGEKQLFACADPAYEIGELFLAGDGSGVWTPNSINAPSGDISGTGTGVLADANGFDLVISVQDQLKADADCVVTFNVTFADASTGTAKATFTAPAWVANKSSSFEHGITLDIEGVSAGAGKKITKVTSIASVTNAKRFSKFKVWSLPQDEDAWQEISHVETFDPVIGIKPGLPIPDRLEGVSEVVRARSEPSSLEITALHRAFVDGIMRFGGQEACFRCDTLAGGVVLKERQVAVNCILGINPTFPDGNEFTKNVARGFLERWFGFWAP